MNQILTIWKKELRDTIRDRRTLMAMIIMPMILMPLLIIGMTKFIEYETKKAEEQVVKVAISGENYAPTFAGIVKKQPKMEIVEIKGSIEEAVNNGEVDGVIVIPQNFEAALQSNEPVQIQAVGKSTNSKTDVALTRLNAAVTNFNNEVLQGRFAKQGINPRILSEVSVQTKDLATEQERGGFGLGFLLPLFIVMWSVIGGQYTAIDVSAGEKERKTLEALLLTPAKRFNIVMGKFLAVATTALTSVVVSLGSLYFAIKHFGLGPISGSGQVQVTNTSSSLSGLTFNFSIEPQAILLALIISIFLVMMFSAVLLSVSIFAKSFKEAQNYVTPAYIVVILPVVIANVVPGFKPALWFFALPAINAILLFKEVLVGVYDLPHILVTIFSLIIYSLAAISIASWLFSKEGVLFKS